MTVTHLIEELQKMPSNSPVYVSQKDGSIDSVRSLYLMEQSEYIDCGAGDVLCESHSVITVLSIG